MGYKFEVKQAGDAVVRGFSEPVDSSLGTKWPCKRSVMIIGLLVTVICASIGIGVGIHVMESKEKKNNTQPEVSSQVTDSGLLPPKECPWLREESPLVVLSIGGFGSDYFSRNITPSIFDISRIGARAPYMIGVNPTLTAPNLYSIVTGLYPESHGIVHDTFTDPSTNKKFNIKDPDTLTDPQWWTGEPIWVTLGKRNQKTAAIGWPGIDVNLNGVKPIVFKMNTSRNELSEPIQQIFSWLELPSNQRPRLILWYIDYAVKTMQTFGPHSPLVHDKLREIDDAIGNLWIQLEEKYNSQCVNLMIISDHGMSVTSSERLFNFQRFLPATNWKVSGETLSIIRANKKVTTKDIEDLANTLECREQNIKVFTRSSAPKRYHVFKNQRSGDIFLQANDRWLSSRSKYTKSHGSSGYDNRYSSMRAIFTAVGPGFRDGLLIEPFENIELYNMMSELLQMEPTKNNGTAGSLSHILTNTFKPNPTRSQASNNYEKSINWTVVKRYLEKASCFNETGMDDVLLAKLKNAVKNKITISEKHVPMGPPVETTSNNCNGLLYQTDFVVGTGNDGFMPLWSSTTLESKTKWTDQLNAPSPLQRTKCIITDARVSVEEDRINGFQDNQDVGYLYNLDFLDAAETYLSSNVIPMFPEFRNGIWKFLWQTLKQYSKSEMINVVVGPVFDKDHDGIADTIDRSNASKLSVPSHFFVILSKCRETKKTNWTKCLLDDALDVLSFVLPHRKKIDNCMNYAEFLEEHIVRIRDVELLTGLTFFESYLDHLAVVRKRVFLPPSLWPSFNTETWLKQPCLSTHRLSCSRDPVLLLISLSGFSPSHFNLYRTPVLDKLRTCGVQSSHMRPVYPTNQFANTHSIVTGLYPESHGMLSKYMYDPILMKTFNFKEKLSENQTWWGGEPIWVTAEKQNKRTAVYNWPGSEASIQGIRPSKWIPSGWQFSFNKRIKTILDWLSIPGDERPNFISAHFTEPDLTAHKYGANSHRIENALKSINDFMGQLMNGLKERNLEECVNVIVVSDHGIQSTSKRQTVTLEDENLSSFITEGATVFQRPGIKDVKVNEKIKKIHCTGGNVRTYTKATLPYRFHFSNNRRIGDVILMLDDGWLIKPKSKMPKSAHGYDNRFDSMQSIFLASGPSFKRNVTIEPFENIELYNLFTELLNIQPVPNNGTEGTLKKLLKKAQPVLSLPTTKYHSCCSKNSETSENFTTGKNHVPFGVPNFQKAGNFCILHTASFALARSNDIPIPMWFSYNLPPNNPSNVMNCAPSGCTIFENADLNMTTGSLFITGEQHNYLSSNVPMYEGFKEGIWKELSNLLQEYSAKYSRLNIITGPIFKDGLDSVNSFMGANCSFPVPTHFYVILTKFCSASHARSCKENSVEVLSFILPHVEKDQNCLLHVFMNDTWSSVVSSYSINISTIHDEVITRIFYCLRKLNRRECKTSQKIKRTAYPVTSVSGSKPKDYLFDHTVRIRDIEQRTGLTFMTDLPWEDAVRIRTYLPLEMWEGLRPSSWMKLPQCMNLDKACKNSNRPVLLISLDGFRADYTKYNATPVINRLRHCGIQTQFMQPAFPSLTFPNHYTMATGLYPESHGIVGNFMYDMEKDMVFTMGSTEPFWWGGETIWKTIVKAGKESASYFFVGSSISGQNATYYYPYNGKTPYEKRINQAIAWLKQGIPFVSIYFEEPDYTGHSEGPSSKQIINTLRLVDSYIGQLMNKLYEEDLHNCVNIIIVADHGMTGVDCERSLVLYDIVDKKTATKDMFTYRDGRVTNKYWQDGKKIKQFPDGKYAISTEELLSKFECGNRHMRVFKKEFLPKRLHYAKHKRLGDIQVLADDTWKFQRKELYCQGKGSHGYDNRYKSMRALFLAYGPDFKQNTTAEPFENIEIYNLLTDMLNVKGAPNNGTEGRLHGLLRRPPREPLRQSLGQYENISFNMTRDNLTLFLRDKKCLNFTPTNKEVTLLFDSLVHSNNVMSQEKINFPLPLLKNNISIQLLRQKSYLTAYDSTRKRPLFIVAMRTTTKQQQISNHLDAGNGCIPDPRMPFDHLKYHQPENDDTWLNLASTDSSEDEINYLSTSFIRVAKAFKKDFWNEALKVLQKWRISFPTSEWFVGPIYDYDLDGRPDSDDTIKRFTNDSLPTHVFLVLVAYQKDNVMKATTAYIIPSNQYHLPKCRRISQLLRDHQARVRDVELLTDLEFFAKEPFSKAVIHRTSMIDFK